MEQFSGGARSQMNSNNDDMMLYGGSYQGALNDGWDYENVSQYNHQPELQPFSYPQQHQQQYHQQQTHQPSYQTYHTNYSSQSDLQQAILQRQFDQSLRSPQQHPLELHQLPHHQLMGHRNQQQKQQFVYSHNNKPSKIKRKNKESQWMLIRTINWIIDTLVDPIFQVIFYILNLLIGWIF